MGITKREIASELGVSKRTVANYIEKLGLGNHVSRNGNTDFLDDFAAAAIADALKNPGKPSRQPADAPAAPAPDSLVDSLAAQLEIERSRNAELMEALAAERDRAARAEARRRLAPALEVYRLDVRAYRREFAAVAKSAAGTDYSEFPRPRVPVPDDELAKYEPLAVDSYIAAKTACDRLVDRYAVNLPDGGDLNDGSTASPATQTAQPARTQDRSIERFGGTRER